MSLVMNDLKYFVTVCETLNITRASEIIGISQPALSYSIKRLERELGGVLLIRMKNGIRLSKLGEELSKRARKLLFEWVQTQNLAHSDSGFIQGTYTFAIHPSVAIYTVGFFMPVLQMTFPSLKFNFIHGLSREMTEKVISWEADFGIVVNPIKHRDLVVSRLCSDEFTLFSSLGGQNKLIYDPNLVQSQQILRKIQKTLEFSGEITSENLEVVAKLTALGLGYGLLPSRIASQYKVLKRVSVAPVFKDEICLVYRPERHSNSVSKTIIKTFKSALIF